MPEEQPPVTTPGAPVPQAPSGVVLPNWAVGFGKYLLGLIPIVFGFWLSMHDLQQDFVLEQEKVVTLGERVKVLEAADRSRELRQTQITSDLTYIRTTLDDLKGTLERVATR